MTNLLMRFKTLLGKNYNPGVEYLLLKDIHVK